MKKNIFLISLALVSLTAKAQDKILSIGYSKNFVNKDSSNFAIQFDLNRTTGKSENAGSFYLVNTPIKSTPFDFYLKPTADVNIGSYTTSAPNNISVGLPFGFAYEVPKFGKGLFTTSLEFSTDAVAEKSLQQYLYYFSPGVTVSYSYVDPENNNIIDIGVGTYFSNGKRLQNIKTKVKNTYQKVTIPLSVSMNLFKNIPKNFYRLKFTGIYKYSDIKKDDRLITPDRDKNFVLLKLDYFFIKQLGINITYNAGYEEPLFKKVNSLSFGITLAR